MNACKNYNVAGSPVYATGDSYFSKNANAAPEPGCTFSACTPYSGDGITQAYTDCEHATAAWKALTNPANTGSPAARVNANIPCTSCPAA
ncbi:hypothetical protein WJX72_003118 [[Myrmecia] bisecta]|uniref:Uncharacterized protein n=1 Tax=[Myrmecia] bisecta TaxID=41462 RepID=A0AAW1R651_9CHLO